VNAYPEGEAQISIPNLTPLAGGAAGIRHFVLFWNFFPIFR
jgi:hypothetical protein